MSRFRNAQYSRVLSDSASPYLSVLLVGTVLGAWAGYLWPESPLIKGQGLAIVVPLASFVIAAVLWLALDRRPSASGPRLLFLLVLAAGWLLTLVLFRTHGDLFAYTALSAPFIIAMVTIKPPNASEGTTALVAGAWALATMLVGTRLLEMLGVISVRHLAQFVIDFDEQHYWLPINDLLGINGRWPGPFGHYNTTALAGSYLVVIAFAFARPGRWILAGVGALTLVVTAGRSSIGATAAGLFVLLLFTRTGWLSRVSMRTRIIVGSLALGATAAVFLFTGAGLTGRNEFWPAFLNLWRDSPWVGVGTSGISVSGGITQQWGHAHNLYVDLLARYGIAGLLAAMAPLAVGLVITWIAALRESPGFLAIVATYLVAGLADTRNDWLHPGTNVLVIVIAVTAAGAYIQAHKPELTTDDELSAESMTGT